MFREDIECWEFRIFRISRPKPCQPVSKPDVFSVHNSQFKLTSQQSISPMFVACKRSADRAAELATQLQKEQRFSVSYDSAPRTPRRTSHQPPRKPIRALTPTRERKPLKQSVWRSLKPKAPKSTFDFSNRTHQDDDISSFLTEWHFEDNVSPQKFIATEHTLPTLSTVSSDKSIEENIPFERLEVLDTPSLPYLEGYEGLNKTVYIREMRKISKARETNLLTTSGW